MTAAGLLSAEETPLEALDVATRQDWAALASRSRPGALFAAPGFAEAFAEVFGRRAAISVLLFREADGTLAGVVPLMRARVARGPSLATRYAYLPGDERFLQGDRGRRPLRVAQLSTPLGLEATALRSELLAAPGRRSAVLDALPGALARLGGWTTGLLALDDADAARVCAGPLPARPHRLERELKFLARPRPAAEIVAEGSKKFRQNIRRAENFAEEAGARFDVLEEREAVRAALPDFADLARRSWKRPEGGGKAEAADVLVPHTQDQQRFMARLAAAPEIAPLLFRARLHDRLAAAMLCARLGAELFTLLLFTDQEAGRLSLGRLLLHRVIDHAVATGVERIDWNSNASWTARYADAVSVRHNLVLAAPGPRARVLAGLAGAVRRR